MSTKANQLVARWLTEDIDDAARLIAELPLRLHADCIRETVVFLEQGDSLPEAFKAVASLQVLSSNDLPLLASKDAIELASRVENATARYADRNLSRRAGVVASLLRLRRTDEGSRSPAFQHNQPLSGRHPALAERLDIKAAVKHVKVDVTGDWYKDPWGWPELDWLVTPGGLKTVAEHVSAGVAGEVVRIDVPKPGGGIRPACLLSPLDRVTYQALVDNVAPQLVGTAPSWVYGWRLRRDGGEGYADNMDEWRAFRERQAQLRSAYSLAMRLDVHSFFSNIDQSLLISQLKRKCRAHRVLDRLHYFLQSWHFASARGGIPQRSLGSSILAQGFLEPLDRQIERLIAGRNVAVLRWMDDLWVFADSDAELRNVTNVAEDVLAQLLLTLNPEKTRIIETSDEATTLATLDASALDSELKATTPNEGTVLTKFKQLLDEAENVSRADISFLTRKSFAYDLQPILKKLQLETELSHLAHAADIIARAWCRQRSWPANAEWYAGKLKSITAASDWEAIAWAEMFPRDAQRRTEVNSVDLQFSRTLEAPFQTLLIPIAAHFHTQWDINSSAIDRLKAAADKVTGAFEIRALAWALLKKTGDRKLAGEWFAAFNVNTPLVEALATRD